MIKIRGLILNIDPDFVDYRWLEPGGGIIVPELICKMATPKGVIMKNITHTPLVKCSKHAKFESRRVIAAGEELSLCFMYVHIYVFLCV